MKFPGGRDSSGKAGWCWRFGILVALVAIQVNAAMLHVTPGPFRSGKAYVRCTFDGERENCFLDTGSAMTLVPADFSAHPKQGTFRFKSATGKIAVAEVIQVGSVELDGRRFSNVRVGRLPAGSAGESTLGMDILSRQPFALEFRDTTVLRLAPSVPRKVYNTLGVTEHGLLSIPVQIGPLKIAGLVDTGASVTAVDPAFIESSPENFRPRKRFMRGVDGTGHSLLVPLFEVKELKIGRRTFRNIEVVAADLGMLREGVDGNVHAVIGFNVLRRTDWYFDPKNKSWSVR